MVGVVARLTVPTMALRVPRSVLDGHPVRHELPNFDGFLGYAPILGNDHLLLPFTLTRTSRLHRCYFRVEDPQDLWDR